ncbi:MAG: AbrB/MazE/SpoVT family DNA-binding domain-containing protein [Tepidiformaceae bacterium]
MKVTVTERGEVVVPEEIVRTLHAEPGETVEVAAIDGRVVIHVTPGAVGNLEAAFGFLKDPGPTDEWIEELRGDAGSG